ncbi:MAG: hypothetical protein IJR77_00905 [Bacteroidales bacterium]|nr:hypothetical protein [Bacteroidales bacterium]
MRRFLTAATFLFLLSCTGGKEEAACSEIRVRVVGATRAGIADEVRTLDLLVFRSSDGLLERRTRVEGALSVSLLCPSGLELKWYLVANAPEELSFESETAFLEGMISLSDLNEAIPMHEEGNLYLSGEQVAIDARLKRYPCKISLDAIRVPWMEGEGAPSEIRLGRVAVINAVGTCPYSAVPFAGELWFNKAGFENYSPLLTMDYGGILIPSSGLFSSQTTLYALPNPTDNDINSSVAASWCPRNTRLSVELLADGSSYWYPIDLPGMEGNCHYRITELVITGPGAAGPDMRIERNPVSFELLITPWDSVSSEIDFGGEL